jgi:hypothetical protein
MSTPNVETNVTFTNCFLTSVYPDFQFCPSPLDTVYLRTLLGISKTFLCLKLAPHVGHDLFLDAHQLLCIRAVMFREYPPTPLPTLMTFYVKHGAFTFQNFFWHDSPNWDRASSFTRFFNHTQRRTTVGRTPLDEWSARSRDLYLTTHNIHNRHIHAPGGIRSHDLSRRAVADQRTKNKCSPLMQVIIT